jgi:hypothetical protein
MLGIIALREETLPETKKVRILTVCFSQKLLYQGDHMLIQ